MRNPGEAVKYAILKCRLLPDTFMDMFIVGELSDGFERGAPWCVSGMSGTELVCETIRRAGLRFRDIRTFLPLRDILQMYPALHEAPEEKFLYAADQIRQRSMKEARLQQIRRLNAYSQKILSVRSGVSLRMIQQYEQGAKDIRKASASWLYTLAAALHCSMEDLILE